MTMQHPIHPDDERLAALAGDDPEVASDAALRAHVDSCDRCGELVRELGSLRAALAELPDLVPPRQLQLLPPVPEAKVPARSGWLRRLAAPAMAAGFVLVVVGAIGSSGFTLGMASSGAAPNDVQAEAAGGDSEEPAAPGATARSTRAALGGSYDLGNGPSPEDNLSTDQESASSPKGENAGPPSERGGTTGLLSTTDPRLPWLVVLGLGVGLLLAGIYLRFAQQPRAG
jgi:anti-sigma factor RsiW